MSFDASAYIRIPCTADTPTIRLSQGQQQLVQIVIRDADGNAVDLTQLPERAGITSEFSSSSSDESSLSTRLAASYCLNASNVLFSVDGRIEDPTTGLLEFPLTAAHTNIPGLLVASVGVFHGDILLVQQMVYMEFMPNNFAVDSPGGPITIPEVRLTLMDQCPKANYLIDELEFTDSEIIHAMRMVVDLFNESPPPLRGYTYANFPFRAHWLLATVGVLLGMIAHRYRRNSMRYSAGGVTVSDQERVAEYERTSERLTAEFNQWMVNKKVSLNVAGGFRSIGPSPYGYG